MKNVIQYLKSSNIAKFALLFGLLFLTTSILSGQSPGDIFNDIKNAKTWEDILGMFDMISVGLVVVITQLKKYIPFLEKIKGPYMALAVTIIIVVIGAIKFGLPSIGTPLTIWAIATLIYDKFFKKETAEKVK